MRLALCASFLALSGCMAVLGYMPTDAELEAIRRGEDPRANEDKPADTQAPTHKPMPTHKPDTIEIPVDQAPGPVEGTVLRWIDCYTLVIEAEGRRQTVLLQGPKLATHEAEAHALDGRMNDHTFGTIVRLGYPLRDKQDKPIYRDARGNLLAKIR